MNTDRVAETRGSNHFRIISTIQTETGSVVRASEHGVEREFVLPTGMMIPSELVEQGLFPSDSPSVSRADMSRANPRAGWNRHLSFYGSVVDEKDTAIPGAVVSASMSIIEEDGSLGKKKLRVQSDSSGLFAVEQPWGQSLMIEVGKRPDYIDAKEVHFQYGLIGNLPTRHVPDLQVPVRFVLHRRKEPGLLIAFDRWFRAPKSGLPVRVDLSKGELVVKGGDLVVSIHCPEPYTNLRSFPWELAVFVEGGGLARIPSSPQEALRSEYLHEAPEDGYEPSFTKKYSRNSEDFVRQFDSWFYVKSRGGWNYAKLYFSVSTFWDERGVPFGIRAVVNTNGSRNLQTPID